MGCQEFSKFSTQITHVPQNVIYVAEFARIRVVLSNRLPEFILSANNELRSKRRSLGTLKILSGGISVTFTLTQFLFILPQQVLNLPATYIAALGDLAI